MIRRKMLSIALAMSVAVTGFTLVTLRTVLAQHSHQPQQQPEAKKGHDHEDMIRVGKKGEISFSSKVRVGDVMLEPGDYQMQHVVEGPSHVIVFKKLVRPGGYREPEPGKEVARVTCKLEPLSEKAKFTGWRYGTNAAGEKTIEEVHVAGENVKHVF